MVCYLAPRCLRQINVVSVGVDKAVSGAKVFLPRLGLMGYCQISWGSTLLPSKHMRASVALVADSFLLEVVDEFLERFWKDYAIRARRSFGRH